MEVTVHVRLGKFMIRRLPNARAARTFLATAMLSAVFAGGLAPATSASAEPTSVSAGDGYRQKILADAPIGYWPLTDDLGATSVRDETGRTPGYAQGGAVLGVASGPVPGTTALRLDGGACSGVDLSHGAAALSPQTLSLEAWVRTESTVSTMALFRRRWHAFLFGAGVDGVFFGTTATEVRGPSPVTDGAWHHVAAVVEVGAQARLYFDGRLVGEVPLSQSLYYAGDQTAIGRDGGACDDVVRSWTGDLAHVAIYDHALSAQRIMEHADPGSPDAGSPSKYVALGDSYSSGEGTLSNDSAEWDAGTGTDEDACHRSRYAWPQLLGAAPEHHYACSGAVIKHLYKGQKKTGLNSIGQIERLRGTSGVGLVTITIGGNDVGFAHILSNCFLNSCFHVSYYNLEKRKKKVDEVALRIRREVLPDVRAAAPTARVVLVGYPYLFPGPDEARNCLYMDDQEIRQVEELQTYADVKIKAAAEAAGVEYVSILDALDGHELCTEQSFIFRLGKSGGDLRGHPRPKGQSAIASTVGRALGRVPTPVP